MKLQPPIDWPAAIKPLNEKYAKAKHPLEAENLYQMLVMVILAAQTTENVVNIIAPDLFKAYPTMASLAKATPEKLQPLISKIRNNHNKAGWLIKIASEVKKDAAIPLTMEGLVQLPGIGRKSANVIKLFAGAEIEGVMVDLHTVRVSNRLGIATSDDPKKIEQQMMQQLPKKEWEAGMAMSYLGREICRPKPLCPECLMRPVCAFYNGWEVTPKQ
jgi:endonuclease III